MKRTGLAVLGLAAPVLLAVQLIPPPGRGPGWPGAVFALVSVLLPAALILVGAARGGRPAGAVVWVVLLLAVVLEGAVAAVLALSGASPEAFGPWIAGLPPAALAELAGFWLLPLPLAALGYALTFRRTGPTPEDLRRLRARLGRSPERLEG